MAYPRSIRPDYSTGTITLTAGSKNFTTAGSSLESANVFTGDLIMSPTGLVLIIDEITGQNSGTLMEPCPAMAAASGIPVRIRFQPDGSRFQAAYRELAMAQTGGNLAAFADLVGAMDMVPVFTGQGAIALVAKSEFGPTDAHGNLAELAELAKENNQFIIMGADGTIELKPISDITNAISANTSAISAKFTFPSGGSANQLIDGTGALTTKAGLPISTATQNALNLKASTTLVNTKSSYNWIINGDFTINQRSGVKKPANGVYGYDRWKGHANGIEQIIEALPAGEYTLTWSGGGNGTFGGQTKVSPIVATVAGGNTPVVVPATATKVSVIAGDATSGTDPFYPRHIQQELALCQRYCEQTRGHYRWNAGAAEPVFFEIPYKITKRTVPTITNYEVEYSFNLTDISIETDKPDTFTFKITSNNSGPAQGVAKALADAEL